MSADVREKVRAYVTSNFVVAEPSSLADETSLIETGVVDSTGVLEIIGFIEGEFGIKVEDAEMIPANLESVSNLVAYINRKRG